MTYAGLNAWFLAVVAVVALLAVVRMDTRRRRGAPTTGPTAGTWLLGVGGVFLAAYGLLLNRNKVVPINDPRLPESLAHENY